ncbi:Ger(x)C family spore germination protein [Paenibacillus alkalitolerans]|uniref:Ger(x)C family spore germination protein n=1 Tax=Paenibacillus alkalitolerans TaxID=2799335 RepID=UPI0018F394EE|nr:Ger(x)C family spore germination protein [Paenibacillus alkalitolerans]
MRSNRKVFACTSLILCLGLFTGCWDRIELDDLALVMASGIDLAEDGQIEATLQIALPTGIPSALQTGAKGARPVLVVSAKGKDGMDALGRLQMQLSRKIFLGHRGIVVFGEKYARQGLDTVLSALLRSPDSRYNSYVLTAYGTTAKEILNTPYQLEQIPAIGLNKIQFGEVSLSFKIDEFLNAVGSSGSAPITGAVRIIKTGSGQRTFTIDKAAVYRENKLVGFLSDKELNAKRWWHGEAAGMRLTVKVEPKTKEFNGTVTADILSGTKMVRTTIKNGRPEASIALKATVTVMGNNTKLDISKVKNMKRVEKKLEEDVRKLFEDTISRSQKWKADIFSFGREVHIEHPLQWKKLKDRWPDIYAEMPVKVKVDIQIERMGRTQAPAHLRQERMR